jgi:hypothetical protein
MLGTGLLLAALGCGSARSESAGTFAVTGQRFSVEALTQYKLPKSLREVSGLAVTPAGTLLAHNDERAAVYRIDPEAGRVLGFFQLGQAAVPGDFEGIAVARGRVYLVTSSGSIYGAALPEADAALAYEHYPAELPCEIEGLVDLEAGLLALCKNVYDSKDVLRAYRWSLEAQRYDEEPLFSFRKHDFEHLHPDLKKLRPSGITRSTTGGLVIIARHGGREHGQPVLIELSAAFELAAMVALPDPKRHPQPEGISLHAGALLLADEGEKGDNKRRGTLSVYRAD